MSDEIKSHPAYQTLKPFARAQTEGGAAKPDVTKTVDKLSELARKASSEGDGSLDDALWSIWNAFFTVVAETPLQSQDALLDLLVQLRQTTVTSAGGGAPLSVEGEGQLWADLPTFGWVARDAWNYDVNDPGATAEQQASFNNQSALLARLTVRAVEAKAGPDDPFDFTTFGLWALRSAFEEEAPEGQSSAPAIKNAAVWLRYAGPQLRDLSSAGTDLPQNMGRPGDLYSGKQWKGFNKDRWSVWIDGFKAASSEKKVDEEALALIKTGLEQI